MTERRVRIDKDYHDLTLAAKRNGCSTQRLRNYFQFGRKKQPREYPIKFKGEIEQDGKV